MPFFYCVGSQAEYGINGALLSPNTACVSNTAFGASKFSAMSNCSFQCTHLGLRFLGPVFSVSMAHTIAVLFGDFYCQSVDLSQPIAFTDATNLWDFLHSYDAAKALYLISSSTSVSGIFNIASGISRPLRSYIEEICCQFGIIPDPYFGCLEHASSTVSLTADISALGRSLDGILSLTFRMEFVHLFNFKALNS